MSQILELRKQLIKQYCSTLLWIDDQIASSSDTSLSSIHKEFFLPLSEYFSCQGLLCHLQHFPNSDEEENSFDSSNIQTEIDTCSELSTKADIVLIDWFLGAPDSPENSKRIIEKLREIGGTKFVVVLSAKADSLGAVADVLGSDFNLTEDGHWLRSDNDIFVTLKQKSDFEGEDKGAELLDQIFNQLNSVYPDFLHWAAIEIASKIKKGIPNLLSSLPKKTDLGLLAQKLAEPNKLSPLILENFFEDLKEAGSIGILESVENEAICLDCWDAEYGWKTGFDSELTELNNSNQALSSAIARVCPDTDFKLKQGDLNRIYQNSESLVDKDSINRLLNSHRSFGEYTEITSPANILDQVSYGAIIHEYNAASPEKVLICISQECDCSRKTDLLYLEAARQESRTERKPNESSIRYNSTDYKITSDVTVLKTITGHVDGAPPSPMTVVSRLRNSHTARIANRFWSQTTRLGINVSEYLREFRQEID